MKKKKLDFDLSLNYFVHQLNGGNEVSQKLVKCINFEEGNFYALLPNQSTGKSVYEFQSGGILPQNPEIRYCSEGEPATYSIIPTMHDKIVDFILQKLTSRKELSCVFEELLDSPNSPQLSFFQESNLLYLFNNEVYYLITNSNIKQDTLLRCLQKSNAIWHSLCILTTANCKNIKHNKLTHDKIKELCSMSELIIVGAYDGEGYIFWEKS